MIISLITVAVVSVGLAALATWWRLNARISQLESERRWTVEPSTVRLLQPQPYDWQATDNRAARCRRV